MARDFQTPGRSAVYGTRAMIATSHTHASRVGLEMLARGGSAVDAAVAASAMLGVVEPHMTGIGGDCFAIVAAPGAAPRALMGSGPSPRGVSREALVDMGLTEIPGDSPHAINLPGAVAAWVALHEAYGRLPLADVLEPAARAAEEGYVIAPRVAFDFALLVARVVRHEATTRLFLKDGAPLAAGDVHRHPALATTLRTIGREGRAGFYEGAVAQDMVDTLRAAGGTHTLDDFAAVAPTWTDPIQGRFAGRDLLETPPNGQGATALLILAALEGFAPWAAADPAERARLFAEATRAAYRLRDRSLTDPAAMPITIAEFLDEPSVRFVREACAVPRAHGAPVEAVGVVPWETDTICLSVVDENGLVVSFMNSLYHQFGATRIAERSGVLFNSRGACFSLEADHPNRLAPGKQTMHTIIPGLVMENGVPLMPFGIMGGHYQSAGHAHLLIRLFEEGMDLQSAVDAPRLFGYGGRTEVERGIDAETIAHLHASGSNPQPVVAPMGGTQAILIDRARGVLVGASDPRKDGCALGM